MWGGQAAEALSCHRDGAPDLSGEGGDKLGAGAHSQGVRGCGRRAAPRAEKTELFSS